MHTTRPWLRFIEGSEGSAGAASDGQDTNSTVPAGDGDGGESEDVDWKAKAEEWKKHARTWEDRAKANQDAAAKLSELEEQDKTELQKALERAEAAEKERDEAVLKAMRLSIASAHNISAEDAELFLNGSDEETLTKQAEALARRTAPKPPESPGQGVGGDGAGSKTAAESWAKSLLGK